MISRAIALAAAMATLTACDAATQIAGEAVQGEIRNAVALQCQEASQGAGIVAGRVAEVCECTADSFMADRQLTLDDVSRERIEGLVNQCTARTAPGGATRTAPMEQTGG